MIAAGATACGGAGPSSAGSAGQSGSGGAGGSSVADAAVEGAPGGAGSGGSGANSGSGGASGGAGGSGGNLPVDCSAIGTHPGWELCEATATECKAVFNDSAGCAAVCASAGLTCSGAFENADGTCAPDTGKPALSCDGTGHQSDYCVCSNLGSCVPDCAAKACGPDGCGGVCGNCAPGDSCEQGVCGSNPVEDCASYPYKASTLLAERMGFGADTTGGDPARIYHVTTLADGGSGSLRAALESSEPYWIVFDVQGKIVHPDRVDVRSNKTVDGRGRDITIEGNLRLEDVQNVILSDVRVTNDLEGHCTQAGDVITIIGTGGSGPDSYSSRNIWVHHVEAFNGGDGLLDIRGGSKVTVSWGHFHTHKKALLCGMTSTDEPATGMRVTFHHNFFDRTTLRGPQFLFGWAHFLNNYQFEWYEYGAASLGGAQFFSENNIYEARPGTVCLPQPCPDPNPCGDSDWQISKKALVNEWDTNGTGYVRSVGDLALNDAVITVHEPAQVFDPSTQYAYVADLATDALKAKIAAEAGPRVDYCK